VVPGLAAGGHHLVARVDDDHLAVDAATRWPTSPVPPARSTISWRGPAFTARPASASEPVDAEAHQVVQQVVAARDAAEHVADERSRSRGSTSWLPKVRERSDTGWACLCWPAYHTVFSGKAANGATRTEQGHENDHLFRQRSGL
jgi:hypothetical protein